MAFADYLQPSNIRVILATDSSCNRYIISAKCMSTFLLGEHQYTIIRITGQSFMLHQIRKMIGLALAVLRGYATEAVFDIVFSKERVRIKCVLYKCPCLFIVIDYLCAYIRILSLSPNHLIYLPFVAITSSLNLRMEQRLCDQRPIS
ncbi:unnamed protein product [Schistosoma mattheei]|uniref:tRNA pseudouridine synthase n=1 Tax=Schistosoma mattheei TaxID=31246 RepID=A0A183NQ74_9TREM|nr:unnamed protein product [Schistosoma mattheei]